MWLYRAAWRGYLFRTKHGVHTPLSSAAGHSIIISIAQFAFLHRRKFACLIYLASKIHSVLPKTVMGRRFSGYIFFTILLGALLSFSPCAAALTEEGYKYLHSFAEVLHQVEENYVEPVNEKDLIMGAVKGMLMTLDPHTVYMSPDVYKELKVESVGRFGGVGVEVTLQKNWLTVVTPVEGSPAWKAGVKPGDRIVRIDGVSTKGITLSDAVTMMRGRVGSGITLTLMREGNKHPFDVHLRRTVIKVPSVAVEDLGDGYLYARISAFQERTSSDLKKALHKAREKGDVKGLIIDLRNNPGGLLGQAIEIADFFIDYGVIVSTKSRSREISRYDAKPGEKEPAYPIVVLINGGSASASEVLAGALKDYSRAIIIGTQSFGKGSVQSIIELSNGAAMKITVAKYYTPSGQSIQGFGITPHVVVKEEEDDGSEKTKEVDKQKAEAILYLKDMDKYNRALHVMRKHHR